VQCFEGGAFYISGMPVHLNLVLIEDNADFRLLLTRTLQSMGHTVFAQESAEELLENKGATDVDVYLVDLNLPGEDGLSLVRRLRSASPDVGIIVLTARDGKTDRVKGYDSGADLYMVKPIHPPELIAALRRFARRKDPEITDTEATALKLTKGRLTGLCGQVRLSLDETTVLEALVRAPAQKLANWQLACLLEADLDEVFKSNLPVRMARLRKKLRTAGAEGSSLQPLRNFGYQLTEKILLDANS
jgi:DNA-binding response OmpR family regulator